MTYVRKLCSTAMIEVSLSATQTVSSSSVILFNTIRATHSHGVSVNPSTGEITLDTTKHYYIQASIDVTRANTTSDFRFFWINSTGAEIVAANGGYDANWQDNSTSNATYTAVYQTVSPVSPIRLRVAPIASNSTVNLATKLLILEVTP